METHLFIITDTIKLKPFDLTSFQRRFLKNLKGTFDIATSEIVSLVSIQIFVPKIDITDIQIELNLIFTLDFNPKAFKDVKEIEWALISKICKELSCEFEEPGKFTCTSHIHSSKYSIS